MSQYNEKTALQMSCYQNDISIEEFDAFYQKCLDAKRERMESDEEYWENMTQLEEELTEMEIDAALEEAERWSDF